MRFDKIVFKDMEKTVKKVTNFEEQERETLRFWQSRSMSERMDETWEFTLRTYA